MARLLHKPGRGKDDEGQNRSNNETSSPEECKRAEFVFGLDPTPIQVNKQLIHENIQDSINAEERHQLGVDSRNNGDFETQKKITAAPCPEERQLFDHKCNEYWFGSQLWQKDGKC